MQIYDDDTFGIYGDDESDMFITSGDAQSITGYKDFTVSPTVPTAASSSNDTTAASTAFVKTAYVYRAIPYFHGEYNIRKRGS